MNTHILLPYLRTLGWAKMHEVFKSRSQKEDYRQSPENFFFRGGQFWRAKSKKCKKKISKNFSVQNRSLGHTHHLYTYKGHIERVGFT